MTYDPPGSQKAQTFSDLSSSDGLYAQLDTGQNDLRTGVSGTGSIDHLDNNARLMTGTTGGSSAWVNQFYGVDTPPAPTWDKDRSALFRVNIQTTGGPLWALSGWSEAAREHVGFQVAGGDLLGTVSDGVTEATVVLVAGVATGPKSLRYEYTAGQVAEFYVDGVKQGELATNLPAGTSDANRPFHAKAENSVASYGEIYLFNGSRFVQYP